MYRPLAQGAATPAVDTSSSSPYGGYHRDSGEIAAPPVFASGPYLHTPTTGEYEMRVVPNFAAEAVSDLSGNLMGSNTVALRRGERVVVTMADQSGTWVHVRTSDGREGQVPASSLQRTESANEPSLTYSSVRPPAASHGTSGDMPRTQVLMSSPWRIRGADRSSVPYPAAPTLAASYETLWDTATMQATILDLMSRVDKYDSGFAEHDVRLTQVEKRKKLRNRGLHPVRADARSVQKEIPDKKTDLVNVALPPDIFSARFFLDDDSTTAKWYLLLAWITVLLEFGVAVIVVVYTSTAKIGSMDVIAFGSKVAAAVVSSLLVAKDVKENVSFAMVLVSGYRGDLVRVTLNDYILFPFRITAVGLVLLGNLWNILHATDALEVWKDITAMTFVLSFPCQLWDAVLFGVCGELMHDDALRIKDLDFLVKVEASSTAARNYRLLNKCLPLVTFLGMLAGVAYVLIKKIQTTMGTETVS